MKRVLAQLEERAELRAVIITGKGNAFCAGQDLDEILGLTPDVTPDWIADVASVYQAIRLFPRPVISAINGVAAGVGLQIALHSDFRIGCDNTSFTQSEVKVGIPSILGPWVIQRIIGVSNTADMCLTGRTVGAEEALRFGLLNRLVQEQDLMDAAKRLAGSMLDLPPQALASTKHWLASMGVSSFDDTIHAARHYMHQAIVAGEPQAMAQRFKERKKNA